MPSTMPPRAPSATTVVVGSSDQSFDARRHALRRQHGRAGRRVDLLVVMELDDLGRFEERRGELGEPHHQHRADREVGRDRPRWRSCGRTAPRYSRELGVARTGRADDRVHAVLGAPPHVVSGRVDDREVDRDMCAGRFEGVGLGRDLQAGAGNAELLQVDAGVQRVDRRDELHVGRVVYRPAHRRAHTPGRAEHADLDHGREATAASSECGGADDRDRVRCVPQHALDDAVDVGGVDGVDARDDLVERRDLAFDQSRRARVGAYGWPTSRATSRASR